MDSRHILIRFQQEDDYDRYWMRGNWSFQQYHTKILKWTPEFSLDAEPSVVPVWVSLDHLPLYLYAQEPLFAIGKLIGQPIKIDLATKSLSRLSITRICLEVDLLKPLPKRVWIATEKDSFW